MMERLRTLAEMMWRIQAQSLVTGNTERESEVGKDSTRNIIALKEGVGRAILELNISIAIN